MSKVSEDFHYPTLIYDNYCTSCSKFAQIIYRLSRKKIEILGHFDIERSKKLKEIIFRDYNNDPTRMFWYIKEDRASASRLGLIQLIKDIIPMALGFSKHKEVTLVEQKCKKACYIGNNFYSTYGCGDDPKSVFKRIRYLLSNSDSIAWKSH
jgi:hypothetical protein